MPLVFRNVREKKEQIQINLSEKNLYDQKIQIFLDQQQLNQDYFHNLMKQIKTYSNFYSNQERTQTKISLWTEQVRGGGTLMIKKQLSIKLVIL